MRLFKKKESIKEEKPTKVDVSDDAIELRKFCLQQAELVTEGQTAEGLLRIAEKFYQYISTGNLPQEKQGK